MLIPESYYYFVYYNVLLLFVVLTFFYTLNATGWSSLDSKFNVMLANLLFIFILIIIGLRPISWIFGDMGTYAHYFNDMKIDGQITSSGDWGFYFLMLFLSKFISTKIFFFVLALLYIMPLYYASKRLFPNYYYYGFLFLVSSFSFFSYGTNGLRNGLATSFFMLGLSFTNKKIIRWLWFALAWSFHSSMLLPIVAYLLVSFYNSTRFYLRVWFISIVLSLTMGTFWEDIFLKLGLNFSDKIAGYFTEKDLYKDRFALAGFRWDFLIYSALPIAVAYYFIYYKRFKDTFYAQLFNIYLITNAIWILVIRASFSNRFAYLSWFMMGLVLAYPYLKQVYWRDQFSRIGILLLVYYGFTYVMNIFIY